MKHILVIYGTEMEMIPAVGIKEGVPVVVLKIFLTPSRRVFVRAGTAAVPVHCPYHWLGDVDRPWKKEVAPPWSVEEIYFQRGERCLCLNGDYLSPAPPKRSQQECWAPLHFLCLLVKKSQIFNIWPIENDIHRQRITEICSSSSSYVRSQQCFLDLFSLTVEAFSWFG